jgi:cytochrome c oxidase subunit II
VVSGRTLLPLPDARRPRAHAIHTVMNGPATHQRVARGSACALIAIGCAGPQSALDPAGRGAARIADLFWWMTGGALLIWVAVVALALYANRTREPWSVKPAMRLVVWGGAVLPIVVLAGLLSYGLAILPPALARAPEGSLKIVVTGEQWWWRVRYLPAGGRPVDLANEIRLPVGEPVEFQLESRDVIHSFWIPALGGKTDMIPGRQTRLLLEPTRTGQFRGVCAEYCGSSHAFMSFAVVVQAKQEFTRWLARQAEPARPADGPVPGGGEQLFLSHGCGACHTIRGTGADGVVGPDLTHVGSRITLGAGRLPNGPDPFRRWISHTDHLKPKVLMPPFGALTATELDALAAYLESLQ